jgi:hypothetical protein
LLEDDDLDYLENIHYEFDVTLPFLTKYAHHFSINYIKEKVNLCRIRKAYYKRGYLIKAIKEDYKVPVIKPVTYDVQCKIEDRKINFAVKSLKERGIIDPLLSKNDEKINIESVKEYGAKLALQLAYIKNNHII